ncbi:MAG: NADH-quinone oxidoreductase subunit A [Alphaproteobacteria bacterium]|nr:NADH-quinone oxidoreductase subunit A [Alphaproteobacteria bacterium]MCL2505039.1 NADH-quinone oxidoreductase subunit A [Alphaproteobacteria bacterium]
MINDIAVEYLPIVLFIGIAFVVSCAAVAISFLIAKQKPYAQKNISYECGFPPEGDTKRRFGVKYYLIAILFIVFDLEIAFLFPWALVLAEIGAAAFFSMMIFLLVLAVGFAYEWKKGALEWE